MSARDIAFENIRIGDYAEFKTTLAEKDVVTFSRLSGDMNPLHLDSVYAATTPFERPIAHGMLLAALLSRLIGMYMPGKRSLYLAQSLFFKKIVYPGETLVASGEVTAKSISTRIVHVRTTIRNERREVVLEGEAKVKVL